MIGPPNHNSSASAVRDAAIELLEERRHELVNGGRRELVRRLLKCDTATIDDVRADIELPQTMDPRCLGAVPGALAKAGIIMRIGSAPTRRSAAHARPISVWSLVDREAAMRWLQEHPDPPAPMPQGEKKRHRQMTLPGVA